MSALAKRRAAAGFSLIEVMVAVIVICVGLLGIAKMQALSLSNTTTARLRSLAAFEAASLASTMHANRAYWATGGSPAATTTVSTGPLTVTSTDNALQTAATTDLGGAPNNITQCVGASGAVAVCGPTDMAGFDMARWTYSLSTLLPNPSATVSCNNLVVPVNCTINITWMEQAVMSNNSENNVGGTGAQNLNNPSYTLYVEP